MRVKKVNLTNFRNYESAAATLCETRNILIGDNAQGKTNFLEAIELVATGKCGRAQSDLDLIRKGADFMQLEITFDSRGAEEHVAITIQPASADKRRTVEKKVSINGLTQSSMRGLRGRLVAVSFKSQDLYLLRGGPKFRRDWIDTILETLKPAYRELSSKCEKIVTQRNKLLKTFFEKGRMSVTDQDELKVWDIQLAKIGAAIVRHRLGLMSELLPKAEKFQEHISGRKEQLTGEYQFSARDADSMPSSEDTTSQLALPLNEIPRDDEISIAKSIMRMLRERRGEEIARKQTLVGPHRDDINFSINGANAVDFASQGQQRSLVLSLKLAELEIVSEVLTEPPILLLDDVLAELDLSRQGFLMSLVDDNMQTLITTTHIDGFKPEWLTGALFLGVNDGQIRPELADPLIV